MPRRPDKRWSACLATQAPRRTVTRSLATRTTSGMRAHTVLLLAGLVWATASPPPASPPPPPMGLHLSGHNAQLRMGESIACTFEFKPGPPPYLESNCPIQAPPPAPGSPPPPSPPSSPPPPSPPPTGPLCESLKGASSAPHLWACYDLTAFTGYTNGQAITTWADEARTDGAHDLQSTQGGHTVRYLTSAGSSGSPAVEFRGGGQLRTSTNRPTPSSGKVTLMATAHWDSAGDAKSWQQLFGQASTFKCPAVSSRSHASAALTSSTAWHRGTTSTGWFGRSRAQSSSRCM